MVQPAGEPLASPGSLSDLPDPSWRFLMQRGLPTFAVEGFAPVLLFYGLWKVAALAPAIVAATALSGAIVWWQARQGRGGGLAVVTAIFLVIQAAVGLASHSATVYLAQPVVLSACWGVAYFASVAVGRPLVGVFANVWYPFPPVFRASLALRALRSGVVVWRLCERLGIDVAGATEGPPIVTDAARRRAFDDLIAAARAGNGTLDAAACPYPLHELLTHLVVEHGLLLHGSNDVTLDLLEPRPAHDFGTELQAVVACDDGIWPIFYAVIARERSRGVFTACLHVGPRRRLYAFATSRHLSSSAESSPTCARRSESAQRQCRREPCRPGSPRGGRARGRGRVGSGARQAVRARAVLVRGAGR